MSIEDVLIGVFVVGLLVVLGVQIFDTVVLGLWRGGSLCWSLEATAHRNPAARLPPSG